MRLALPIAAAWLALAPSRRSRAKRKALAQRADRAQGRRRLLPDGGETRLLRKGGPQGRHDGVKDDTIGIKALLSGEVDSYLGTAGALAAVARGADVKFVGCPWHGIPYVVLAAPASPGSTDLKGKSIAASAPGTPPDMVAQAPRSRWPRFRSREVKFAAVGADRERYDALLGGVVDAAVVSNEYLPLPSSKTSTCCWRAGRRCRTRSASAC